MVFSEGAMITKPIKEWLNLQTSCIEYKELQIGHPYLLFEKDLDNNLIVIQKTELESIQKTFLKNNTEPTFWYLFFSIEDYPIEPNNCLEIQYKQSWFCRKLI